MNTSSETSMLKIIVVLSRKRKTIVLTTFIAMFLASIIALIIPVRYTGTAVILAPQTSQSSLSAILGQIGGGSSGSLTSMLPEGLDLGFKTPGETYAGILSSRTVADALISKFNLQKLYKRKTLVDTRKSLARHTHIETTKGWFIRITVDDHSAQRAADMANYYVDVLYKTNQTLALNQASQRRLFLEQQVAAETEALSKAEIEFKQAQEVTGVIQLGGQAELTLRSISQLRAELVSRELQLEQLRSVATENNERVSDLETGIAALKSQIEKAEKGAAGSETTDYFLPAGKVPSAELEYIRKMRQLRYHEALFEALSKQYEMARIDEAKAPPLIQVVDKAIVLDKKDWPPRTLLVLLAGILSFIFSSLYVLMRDAWYRATKESDNAKQIAILKSIWHKSARQTQIEA
jgi:tyrosine-protein kinase Etk/Wzc